MNATDKNPHPPDSGEALLWQAWQGALFAGRAAQADVKRYQKSAGQHFRRAEILKAALDKLTEGYHP